MAAATWARGRTRREGHGRGWEAAPRGQWSVHVSGNWRRVFRFVDGEAVGMDLIDDH